MINLTIRMRKAELSPFMQFVAILVSKANNITTTDIYNLRYLIHKIADKNQVVKDAIALGRSSTRTKYVVLKVNINVYDSLLRLFEICEKEVLNESNVLEYTIYKDLIFQMDRQRVNLPGQKVIFT